MKKNIERKEMILQKLKDRAGSVQAVNYDIKSKSYNLKNIMEDEVCRLIFLEDEIEQMKKEYEEIREKVLQNIDSIDNELYRDIMLLRYIYFKKWDDIADILGYSERHLRRLNNEALDIINLHS